jgi:Protein of unknown function (DUF3168)
MTDALFNSQAAIYNALAANDTIQSLLGSPPRLYDHVPPGAVFPYMVFGAIAVQPYDTKTEIGFEQIITLDIWSRYRGSKEAKDILQAAYDALHRAILSVSSEVFLLSEFHSAELVLESDGITYRAAARFSLITQTA